MAPWHPGTSHMPGFTLSSCREATTLLRERLPQSEKQHRWLWVKTNGIPSWVGAPPIIVYFSGDWDVHWEYDLDFAHGHMKENPKIA